MRKEFEMTEEQLKEIIDAGKPVPYLMPQCGRIRSPQENANSAWQGLAKKMDFVWDTVRPVSGKGSRFFTAECL